MRSPQWARRSGPRPSGKGWTGEALSAGWLTATELGVSVLPLSAPIEVIGTREALRRLVADLGYPYLVLRLGSTDPERPVPAHALRPPADQIIEGQ